MTTPEGKVKKEVKRILESHEIYYYMPVPSGYGRRGPGDFLCCVNSKFLSIEAKGPDGKETELQEEDSKAVRKSKGLKLIIKMENLYYLESFILRLLES